ncbi:AKR_HP2_G0004120.mRNA.1.CDS.1 [Saccharomyces cerevisiae]|nr:AKR_HP2_G0004120.mRNA.1.CDS.1 [Saccharomyces cerevisiae]CAI6406800.1 AKR_HP2_G0004120.mRNA.1.CDS.1 [Saccharomyces cerevisiae]
MEYSLRILKPRCGGGEFNCWLITTKPGSSFERDCSVAQRTPKFSKSLQQDLPREVRDAI